MPIKRRFVWTSLVMGASLGTTLGAAAAVTQAAMAGAATDGAISKPGPSFPVILVAGGEGGEGGEGGGEGGEGGVDFEKAALDPVVFLTALDVIRAHYLSGLDAYGDGHTEAGAQMFAHPIGEIYVGLAPVVKQLGIADFEAEMQAAVAAGSAKADKAVVQEKVSAVLAALDGAAAKAPRSQDSKARVDALVLSDVLNRAALQYGAAQTGGEEAMLDGYGLYKAAAARAAAALPAIEAVSKDTAASVRTALDALAQAFPKPMGAPAGTKQPAAGDVLATVSKAVLALSSVR